MTVELKLLRVLKITRELFGNVRMKCDCDPEFPRDSYTVFRVEVTASSTEIVRLENEWSRRVGAISQEIDPFVLSICPQR